MSYKFSMHAVYDLSIKEKKQIRLLEYGGIVFEYSVAQPLYYSPRNTEYYNIFEYNRYVEGVGEKIYFG